MEVGEVTVVSLITLVGGAFGGAMALWLSVKQRSHDNLTRRLDAQKALRNLHREFHHNKQLVKARAYIACASEYANLEPVLNKRLHLIKHPDGEPLTSGDYKFIETIDQFLNFMLFAQEFLEELSAYETQEKGTKQHAMEYATGAITWWLAQATNEQKRKALHDYIRKCFPSLYRFAGRVSPSILADRVTVA